MMNGEVLLSADGIALVFVPGLLETDHVLNVANMTPDLIVLERVQVGDVVDETLGVVIGPQSSGVFWPSADLRSELNDPIKLTIEYLRGTDRKELTVPVVFARSEGGWWKVTHA